MNLDQLIVVESAFAEALTVIERLGKERARWEWVARHEPGLHDFQKTEKRTGLEVGELLSRYDAQRVTEGGDHD